MSGEEEGAAVGQQDLLSKLLVLDHKNYYLDVRENSQGKYLKLTEVAKYSAPSSSSSSDRIRNTILLPPPVLSLFIQLLKDAILGHFESAEPISSTSQKVDLLASKTAEIPEKKKRYYMDVIQNTKGRLIKIAESQMKLKPPLRKPNTTEYPSRSELKRAVVIIRESGWLQLKRTLDEIVAEIPSLLLGLSSPSSSSESKENARSRTRTRASSQTAKQFNGEHSQGRQREVEDSDEQVDRVEYEEEGEEADEEDEEESYDPTARKATRQHGDRRQASGAKKSHVTVEFVEGSPADELIGHDNSKDADGNEDQGEVQAEASKEDLKAGMNKVTLATITMKSSAKRFFLDLQKNKQGKYLKIAQVSRGQRETVVLPNDLWDSLAALFHALEEGDVEREIENLMPQKPTAPAVDSTSSNSKTMRTSTINARSFKSANGKLFFMDLCANNIGQYLRISEVKAPRRNIIRIPDYFFSAFHQALEKLATI